MADRLPYLCAEIGTYQSSGPAVALSGVGVRMGNYPSRIYAQAAADADTDFDDGDPITVTISAGPDNWAVYESATWNDAAPDTLDLSAATLRASEGMLSDGDAVNVFAAVKPGITDVIDDSTPQLGGDLDSNGQKITASGGNDLVIEAAPPGSVSAKGAASGAIGAYDLKIGDTEGSPTYGMMQLGNAILGRMSHNSGNLDLDGAVLLWNIGVPITSKIQFAFSMGTLDVLFALPNRAAGSAAYSSDSMLLAGPAALDDEIVTLGYWQAPGTNLFENLSCGTDACDLGVQNDLEVEGTIYGSAMESNVTDGASAVGWDLDTVATLATSGALLLRARNNGSDRFSQDKDGFTIISRDTTSGEFLELNAAAERYFLASMNSGHVTLAVAKNYKDFTLSTAIDGDIALVPGGEIVLGDSSGAVIESPTDDGASAEAFVWDTQNLLATAGAIHTKWENSGDSILALDKDGSLLLEETTNSNLKNIIYKNGSSFLHDFSYGDNGLVTPSGNNIHLGKLAGNLTVGATATTTVEGSNLVNIGNLAGRAITTGYASVNVGSSAGQSLTTAHSVVNVGHAAGQKLTTADACSNVGRGAGQFNETGERNTNMGYYAGRGVSGNSNTNNANFGYYAGFALTTGAYNTNIGAQSGKGITTGVYNLSSGYLAGSNITTGDYNIILGAQVGADSATADYQLNIGDLIKGDWGATQKFSLFGATPVVQQSHIADPSGGATQDTEARTAIASINSLLESYGLMPTS